VDYQILQGQEAVVVASGQRAEDMALRLKYAGLSGLVVEPLVPAALRRALAAGPAERPLFVLPTYTAMLQAREVLGDWAAAGHFWEAGD
ncbi:MAG TPA: MurT ligase domain-containing protein, partial [Dehalococcoidia bacterium]|nr:MurT ligase domain-containing protein [Dehalococcoidia bacterium]